MNIKKKIKAFKKKRAIKKFKKFNFPKEMINELNECFTKHGSLALWYLPYPLGHGIEGTPVYQVFKKYGKEKYFKKIKVFPIVVQVNKNGIFHYLDLGD